MSLRELIEAVEAGDVAGWNRLATIAEDAIPPKEAALTATAYNGSLDAAKALHDALLPGWIWGRQVNGAMWVAKRPHTFRAPPSMASARGLLLAILRAMEARDVKGEG